MHAYVAPVDDGGLNYGTSDALRAIRSPMAMIFYSTLHVIQACILQLNIKGAYTHTAGARNVINKDHPDDR